MNNTNLIQAIYALSEALTLLTTKIVELILVIRKIPPRLYAEYIDSSEVCKILNIQPNTLYKNAKKHGIPSHKIGKKIYYRVKDIEKLFEEDGE